MISDEGDDVVVCSSPPKTRAERPKQLQHPLTGSGECSQSGSLFAHDGSIVAHALLSAPASSGPLKRGRLRPRRVGSLGTRLISGDIDITFRGTTRAMRSSCTRNVGMRGRTTTAGGGDRRAHSPLSADAPAGGGYRARHPRVAARGAPKLRSGRRARPSRGWSRPVNWRSVCCPTANILSTRVQIRTIAQL